MPRIDITDLSAGDDLDPWTDQELTVNRFMRYQGASGDYNPIHHDTEFAQAAGFPGPFAIGMLQMGTVATYLTDRFGADGVRALRVQWREQAWPHDVLTYSATVADVRDGEADLELSVTRQTGGVHLKAWATVMTIA
ncbi:dihydroxy-acid dehydratase [soil metagenome]